MFRPMLFLFGYVRFRIPIDKADAFLNMCKREGRIYRNFSSDGAAVRFECSALSSFGMEGALERYGIEAVIEKRSGVPALLWRYRRRYGIFIGAFIAALIIFLSGRFLWDIRVIGNERVDRERVIDELSACGFEIGDYLGNIYTPIIENRMLIESDSVSWISINIRGCVAEVEIKEAVPRPEDSDLFCADLVASRDGEIAWFEETRGNALVEIGQQVKKGDVLISGIYPADENTGERYTVARGKVFAKTVRDFCVEIPLNYEKKSFTGREKVEKYFVFFKKEVKFFGNSGNKYQRCDTIDTVEYFELPRGVFLPFGIRTVRYAEYENVVAKRSEESAIELALYTLRCQTESEAPNAILLKKTMSAQFTDSAYRLNAVIEYIENIAYTKENKINGIQ